MFYGALSITSIRLSLFFVLFFIHNISAQQNSYNFDRFSTTDGLLSRFINCIYQDSRGFIWIGASNGLSRFDGISFKMYYYDAKDTTSIPGNEVKALEEDSAGNLWIMTNHNFCVYNRKTDSFIRKSIRNQRFPSFFFTACHIDRKGYLWLGAMGSIFRYKLYQENEIHETVLDAEEFILKEKDIKHSNTILYSFVEDKESRIWTASCSKDLFYFDEKKKDFIPYRVKHPESDYFSGRLKTMIMDNDGDFILAVESEGLLVWDRKNDRFDLYKPDKIKHKGPNDDILFAISIGPDNTIWAGGRNEGGINVFDKKRKTFNYIQNLEHDPLSLGTDKVHGLYKDRSGTMWVGLNNQLNKYSPNKYKFKRYPVSSNNNRTPQFLNTLCFEESKTGEIWIGTDGGGLSKYNPQTGVYIHYKHIPGNPGSLSSNAVIALHEDSEGTLWIGTFNGGLCSFKNGKFTRHKPQFNNTIALSHVWYVYEDSKKNLWVATLNEGLGLYDRKSGKFYSYRFSFSDTTSLSNDGLIQIFEDSRKNIYISSYFGVSSFNLNDYDFNKPPPDIKFKRFLHRENQNSISNDIVRCIAEDKEGNMWFGSMATGLDKYDIKTGTFTNYSTKDGLPGNFIASILIDDNNLFWLPTDKGLVSFDPETKKVAIFDKTDGLMNNTFHGWSLKTTAGEMYICGPDGFNSFHPGKIVSNTNKPKVYFTQLKIFNSPVKPYQVVNKRIILKENIGETQNLVLSYKEDFFSIGFVALDYTAPDRNQYKYKLEGFNNDWINCGSNREASYTNLAPGEYVFKVQASNSDGVWNEAGAQLQITILSPWWETLWFKVLVTTVLLMGVFAIYYIRLAIYRRRQIKLMQLVKIRTRELEESNRFLLEQREKIEEQSHEIIAHAENLQEANNMLLEKQELIQEQTEELKAKNEQLIVLNETRDKLISIIGHDLRNPFNVISGFSDLLLTRKNLPPDKTQKYISYIKSASFAGNSLLENLLHWSRSQLGTLSCKPDVLDLRIIFEESEHLFIASAQQKNISIISYIDEVKIFADENMMKTVIRNLVSNAIKFTDLGGRIILSTEVKEKFVEIRVTDNGIGIPEEILSRLFKNTDHISTRGTSNESGTGLGLLICKEFVELNRGSIKIESEVGKGTTFCFTIPLADEEK